MTNTRGWILGMAVGVSMLSMAGAQSPDYLAIIGKAKADLNAAGVLTEGTGPCGPFQIVSLAAARIPGAYILDKPSGTHCEWPAGSGNFYASDIIGFLDGRIFDALKGAETENTPQWLADAPIDGSRLRTPVGVSVPGPMAPTPPSPPVVVTGAKGPKGDTGPQGPPGPKGDPGTPADVSTLMQRLADLEEKVDKMPTTCVANANLGFTRIPISCHLQ